MQNFAFLEMRFSSRLSAKKNILYKIRNFRFSEVLFHLIGKSNLSDLIKAYSVKRSEFSFPKATVRGRILGWLFMGRGTIFFVQTTYGWC